MCWGRLVFVLGIVASLPSTLVVFFGLIAEKGSYLENTLCKNEGPYVEVYRTSSSKRLFERDRRHNGVAAVNSYE